MNIVYDNEKKQWMCNGVTPLKIGKNELPIINCKRPISGKSFHVREKEGKLGPFIAILTSKETRRDFFGNRGTFKRIQNYLDKHGGVSFVMTPEGIKGNTVEGYIFCEGEWKKFIFPLPDIIYNRIASYHAERSKGILKVKQFAAKWSIPFYNPHFFEKWETYRILSENEKLAKFLPRTERLTQRSQLQDWLDNVDCAFIKATLSNRGEGIVAVTKVGSGYQLASNSDRQRFDRLNDVWSELQNRFKQKEMVIQKRVQLQSYEDRPFDYRILVQRLQDRWLINGIGVRCAGMNSITTHVPQGGKILPLEVVGHYLNIAVVEEIAELVAYELEKAYGYLCEFSIDLGVDVNGAIWLFEVNSKPMKFDEPHIQKKALQTLIDCFYYDAGFKS